MPLPLIAAAWAIGATASGGAGLGGVGFKKQRDAKKIVEHKHLEIKHAEAASAARRVGCERAFTELGVVKLSAMTESLVPFHTAFSALKNVDLHISVAAEGAPAIDTVAVGDAGLLSLTALDTLSGVATAGGAAMVASGAASYGVTALATASTGTAISTLSGAAAANASLAWLGGGTLATGGAGMAAGTMVLSGVAVAPAMLVGGVFLFQKGKRATAKADEFAADADSVLAHHRQSQLVLSAAGDQAVSAAALLRVLTVRLAMQCGWLQSLVAREDDWRRLDEDDRGRVREIAILAMATSDLVHTPIMAEDGTLTAAIRAAFEQAATVTGVATNG